MFAKFAKIACAFALAGALVGCGERVEIPPAHVGKILGASGYHQEVIPSSRFRLPFCLVSVNCDKLVVMDVSDNAFNEDLTIFIPKDKLNVEVKVRTVLAVQPEKVNGLFSSVSPASNEGSQRYISISRVYQVYAMQIIQSEVREYLSQYSIEEIASSNERMNADIRVRLQAALKERTPFLVRSAGIVQMDYPKEITDAQKNAAQRRESIRTEQAKLEESQVRLQRELEEARLIRQVEKEKAETEAQAQLILAASIDSNVLRLRELENERARIEKWDGRLPTTVLGKNSDTLLNLSK